MTVLFESKLKVIKNNPLPPWMQYREIMPKSVQKKGMNISDLMAFNVRNSISKIIKPSDIKSRLKKNKLVRIKVT